MSDPRFYIPSLEETENFAENLLSASTRKKTEGDIKTISLFMAAKAAHLRASGEDPSFWEKPVIELSEEEIVTTMKNFAIGARTEKGAAYEPVSLQTFWYSLKRHLKPSGMDFSQQIFSQVTDHLKCAFKKLRSEGGGQGPKTSNGLTAEEINFFFSSKCAGAHHPRALINALVIYVMWMGRRGMKELHKMKYGDLYITNSNGHIFVNLRDVQAKNRQGENPQDRNHNSGSLCGIKETFKCPVTLLTLYSEKRPEAMRTPDSPLFLSCNTTAHKDYRREFNGEPWYISTRMGQNTLAKIVKDMVIASGLSVNGRRITNTSIRKNTASTLSEGGLSSKVIMAYTRHKSAASLVHYDSINPAKATQATNLLLLSDASYDLPEAPPVLVSSPKPTVHYSTEVQLSHNKRPISDIQPTSSKRSKFIKSPLPPKNKHPLRKRERDQPVSSALGSTLRAPMFRASKKVCQTVRIGDPVLLASLQQAAPDQVIVQPSLPAPPFSPTITGPSSPKDSPAYAIPPISPPAAFSSPPPPPPDQHPPANSSLPDGFSPLPLRQRQSPTTPILTPPQQITSQVLNIFPDTNTDRATYNGPVTITYNGPVTINKYYNTDNTNR